MMNKSALKSNSNLQPVSASSSKFDSEVTAAIDMLIAKSLIDIKEGRVHSHAAVMQKAAEWLKVKT